MAAETCKMLDSFAWAFRSCTNRIFRSVSTIYCSFHSANHSCGIDKGGLQPSLWLPKLSSILQKLAKCSRALHASSRVRYVATIEFFTQFLQHTALSTQPATHVTVMREAYSHHYIAAKVEQYIAETCKMQPSFALAFRNCTNRIFRSVSTIYCFFHSASHSCGSDKGGLQLS